MRNLTNTEATNLTGLHVQLVDPVTGEQHKTFPADQLGSAFKDLNRWYVDPNGSADGTGASSDPKLTIASAYALAGQGDTVVVNEGVYNETVVLSTQNTTLAGASGAYGSLTQITGVNATASGTSVRVSDLTVTGAMNHTGTAPLYLNNVTVGGAFTASSNVYREIRQSSLQDGGITVTAGTTLIEDSKLGTSSFTGGTVALKNVAIDAGECVTIGAGVVYSLSGVQGCVIIQAGAIDAETAASAAGLPAALAEAVATTTFNNLRVTNPDFEAAPTQFVTRDPVTGELEYSDAPVSGAPVTVGTDAPTGTAIEGAIHLVTDDGTPTGTVLEQYIYDTDSSTWIEMNRNAKSMLKFGTTAPTGSGDWDGEEYFVTSDGTSAGEVLEQWIYDKQSDSWVQRPTPVAELTTTSLTPVVYDGGWVGAQADIVGNLAKEIKLADGTILASGRVTWTGHGLDVGETYYTSQTTAGAYVTPEPTSGLSQKLFTVIDANTVDIQVQEGVEIIDSSGTSATNFAKTVYVNATSPSTATIFDLANPPTTNDNALKANAQNLYIGTNGSTWTYNTSTSTYSTYVYPTTAKAGVFSIFQANQSIPNATITSLTNHTTVSNTAGANWNPTTGVFTAPRAGWYDVSANMFYNGGNWVAGSQEQVLLLVNASTYRLSNYVMIETALTNFFPDSIQTHGKIYLNAGDTIRAQAYQNSGSAKTVGGALYNTFSIVEIG